MDDATNQNSESSTATKVNGDFSLAVVFGVVGFTFLMTLDTPWASLPMLAVAGCYLVKALRAVYRERKAPTEAPDA